jgi:D-proline reductase (dithiol) PrdB
VTAHDPGVAGHTGTKMKGDRSWIPAFRTAYAGWWPAARPLIAGHQYAAAFKQYPWPTFRSAPWTPAAKPLSASRVALVTTGGLYVRDLDPPFDTEALEGDASFRRLPAEARSAGIAIAHGHFPKAIAEADLNTIYPLERLEALRQEGVVGSIASTHYSLMGYAPQAADLAEATAPAIAAELVRDGVDAVLLVPV